MTKKILVTRSSMPKLEEYVDEIRDMWDSHWLTNMGPKHVQFQEHLKKFLGVENIELLTNGHMALELSLQALGLGRPGMHFEMIEHRKHRRYEVITTPFTFASTTHAIVRNGLEPVFCDIDPITFTLDVAKLEALITDYTVAILPVHVYGNICDVAEIDRIAKKYSLKVIYDAAHTFGETYKDKSIGNYGDVSCYSFHATKVFHSIEGGAVCYKDKNFGKELYRLKNFGISSEEVIDGIGANAKMNEFCAAMGICNLRHIEEEIEKRRLIANHYMEKLDGIEGLQIIKGQKDVKSNYAYFPVVFEENIFGSSRNEVYAKLGENGINARKYFYPLTNTFECFHGKYDAFQTPVALHISKKVLTLPIYAELEMKDVDRICDIIVSCKK